MLSTEFRELIGIAGGARVCERPLDFFRAGEGGR
jgi:hypothetical protein